MPRKMRLLLAACLALGMTACGPTDVSDEPSAPEEAVEVEQGIGTTPLCRTGGYIVSESVYTGCGWCTSTKYGLKGSYYERCCYPTGSCDAWKYIKPLCDYCDPRQ